MPVVDREAARFGLPKINVQVTGITLVPHQVKKAKKNARKSKVHDRVLFFEQDYTLTSFPDESFSLIWACESVCHAQEKINFYKEAYRLLKPGGSLIIAEYFRTARPLTGRKVKNCCTTG
jgi:tocopherol O-methyltransferase